MNWRDADCGSHAPQQVSAVDAGAVVGSRLRRSESIFVPQQKRETLECLRLGVSRLGHRRSRGCLLGLATGDALGTTVEFSPRGSFQPLTGMTGGGPFGLEPGQWTDDTSMALCLADSLLAREGFDARDQMLRYVRWLRDGYRSVTGHCFDVGNTVLAALERFERTDDPYSGSTHPYSAGNGSIMRLAPIVLFYMPDLERVVRYAGESSRTTHGAAEAVSACRILAAILGALLSGASKKEAVQDLECEVPPDSGLSDVLAGSYQTKSESDIRGSGYVVESLEAALWSFWHAHSFEEAILRAANLGDDADTTAAVCGQLAGAHWGSEGIPAQWLEQVALADEISSLADRLWAAAGRAGPGPVDPATHEEDHGTDIHVPRPDRP